MKYKKLFASILIASVAILLHTGHASAATINVAAGTDSIVSDSVCTISEAIQNINDQPSVTNADCAAGDGSSDAINLPTGTITLSDDLPIINKPVIISGAGIGNSIIDADSIYTVFEASFTGALSIHDLTVQNFGGRAFDIYLTGSNSTQLYNIEIRDGTHQAMAIQDISNLDIHDVYIHDNNKGDPSGQLSIIDNYDAIVSLKRISIIDNSGGFSLEARDGTSDVNIENMTVSHNSAPFGPNTASLGMLLQSTSDGVGKIPILNVSIKNSTIYNNASTLASPYDLYYPSSGMLLGSGSGAVGYGAGINNVTLENNLFASISLNGSGASCGVFDNSVNNGVNSGLNVTSLGHNYSDDNACSSYLTDSSDKNNLSRLTTGMGTLDTSTSDIPAFALLNTSPAIDGGATVAGMTTDARGIARPQCSAYDVGAYEYNDDCSAINNSGDSGGSGDNGGGSSGGSSQGNGNTTAPDTGLTPASYLVGSIFMALSISSYLGYRVLKSKRMM